MCSARSKTITIIMLRTTLQCTSLHQQPVAHTHISTFGIYSSHGSRENVGTNRHTDRPTDKPTDYNNPSLYGMPFVSKTFLTISNSVQAYRTLKVYFALAPMNQCSINRTLISVLKGFISIQWPIHKSNIDFCYEKFYMQSMTDP